MDAIIELKKQVIKETISLINCLNYGKEPNYKNTINKILFIENYKYFNNPNAICDYLLNT